MDDTKAVILDIGGFTADYLLLKNGQADLSTCDSLENGVILLYNHIRSKANAELDILLDENDVDIILQGKGESYPDTAVRLVEDCLLYTSYQRSQYGQTAFRISTNPGSPSVPP